MRLSGLGFLIITGILLCSTAGFSDTTETKQTEFKQSGFIGFEGGQIMQGENDLNHKKPDLLISKSWQERLLFQYVNNIVVNEHIKAVMAIECQLSYSYPYAQEILYETHIPQFSFYPDRAEAMYSLGDPVAPYLQFGFGYFPFKTNPDGKNLGDYLFRTNSYPLYVTNTFNRPYARLLGLRASSTLGNADFISVHQDIVLNSATLLPPLVDFTLSYLVNATFLKGFEVGGALSLGRVFPIDEKLTTPTTDPTTRYLKQNGDTAYYSFKDIKPMVRCAIDPKPFIPLDIFGKLDLRLYGEYCIAGLESFKNYDTSNTAYQSYYQNVADRTLYMVGFNLPAFKVLDVLSVELEYMPNKYANSAYYMIAMNSRSIPAPNTNFGAVSSNEIDPLYWTVYAKKTFLDRFCVILQFARDHIRPINNNVQYLYADDVMQRHGDWWWNLRLNFNY